MHVKRAYVFLKLVTNLKISELTIVLQSLVIITTCLLRQMLVKSSRVEDLAAILRGEKMYKKV